MDDKELILTGQGEQQNIPKTLDTSIANDLLGDVQREAAKKAPRVGASIGKYGTGAGVKPDESKPSKSEEKAVRNEQFVGGMSGRIKGMLNSPGFTGDTGMYNTDQIEKRRNIAWVPELYDRTLNRDVAYTQDFTSSVPTIIKDSVKQFWMSLGTLGDKAMIGLGGLTSKISGGEIGIEMRDRAYDSLEAKLYNMGLESTEVGDVETLTSMITFGAASMLEMMATGLMTGGIAPLAQMGVEVFGDGTYNNMREYAEQNNGSIEGFEGNWIDLGVDLANAAAQTMIERKLGVGSARFYRGTGGHFVKEGLEGFLQEGSQEFLSDFGEFIKGNEAADLMMQRWQDYLIAGAIGGILQGGLGAATYKASRAQADANAAELYREVVGRANPNMPEEQLYRESRAFAKSVNDRLEQEMTVDMFDELAERVDANNDRGKIRDSLVAELSKAKAASLGLANISELDAQDLADIQDAATILARESVRMAWANGVSIQDTLMARIYADGATLKVRDLKPSEMGVPVKKRLDLEIDAEKLAEQMGAGREAAQADYMSRVQRVDEKTAEDEEYKKAYDSIVKKEIDQGTVFTTPPAQIQAQVDALINKSNYRLAPGDRVLDENIGAIKSSLDDIAAKQTELSNYYKKLRSVPADGATDEQIAEADAFIGLPETNSVYVVEYTFDDGSKREQFLKLSKSGVLTRVNKYDDQNRYSKSVAVEEIGRIRGLKGLKGVVSQEVYEIPVQNFQERAAVLLARDYPGQDFNMLQQSLKSVATGMVGDTGRGRYNSRYQEIILNKDADISTILHEFAHLWLDNYFKAARAENAPAEFVKMWNGVEKALGIRQYDRFLDKDISEKFARSFEKFIADGGKGAPESLKPMFDRLSVRISQVYDDLATRYFDQVSQLQPEVQQWFAWNEIYSEAVVGAEADEPEQAVEEMYEQVTLQGEPVSRRAKERQEARKQADIEKKLQGNAKKQADALNDEVEDAEPAPLKEDSDEPMSSPYTAEGQRERKTSQRIRSMAGAQGILIDARSEYNPYLSKAAAEDAAMMVRMDWERAKDIAMGRIPPQGGIEAETMFIAVRNQALLNNDAYTLKMLQASPIQARITEAAQRLSLVRNFTGNGEFNVVKVLSDIQKIYDGKINEKTSAEIKEQIVNLSDIMKRFDMDTEATWNKLLNEMECK